MRAAERSLPGRRAHSSVSGASGVKSQPRRPRARPSPQHSPQHSPQRLQWLKRRALGPSGRVKSRHSTASSRMGPSCNQPHRACHDARHDDPRSSSSTSRTRHQRTNTPAHAASPHSQFSEHLVRCVTAFSFPSSSKVSLARCSSFLSKNNKTYHLHILYVRDVCVDFFFCRIEKE